MEVSPSVLGISALGKQRRDCSTARNRFNFSDVLLNAVKEKSPTGTFVTAKQESPIEAPTEPVESSSSGLYQSGRYIHNVRFDLPHPASSANPLSIQHAHPSRPNRQQRPNSRCPAPIAGIPCARTLNYSVPGNRISCGTTNKPQSDEDQGISDALLHALLLSMITFKTQTICHDAPTQSRREE